jgi:YidC/Oxa1 family membrane protein insertase
MLSSNLFNTFLVIPILNVLVFLYHGFLLLRLPGAFGWAIIGLTVLVRLMVQPFFSQQLKTAKKMQDLKPHLDKLSLKHKNDKQKLQQEQLRLYQQAGINPAAGCLFMLIQIPLFIALYNTLSLFLNNPNTHKVITEINQVLYFSFLKIQTLDPYFLGYNLFLSPAKAKIWFYYLVPLITGLLQYFQVLTSTPPSAVKVENENSAKINTKDKAADTDDFQKALNTQMKFVFPIMIAYFAFSLPVGLSLYWNIFSLFSIIQSKKLYVKAS